MKDGQIASSIKAWISDLLCRSLYLCPAAGVEEHLRLIHRLPSKPRGHQTQALEMVVHNVGRFGLVAL